MNDKKRLNSYEDLPLVLDVADIQRIMGISRASAYELVHTPGFPAFRRGRLIKVSKIAFFEWMAKSESDIFTPRTGQVIQAENGTQYFVCGNNRIKISEHFAAGGKPLGDLIVDVVRHTAEKAAST